MIGSDMLRADRLGCYGYEKDTSPQLDEFADAMTELRRERSWQEFVAQAAAY